MGSSEGTTRPIHYLSDNVKKKIRSLWGQGTPNFSDAAVAAVEYVLKVFEERHVPCLPAQQISIAVAAGRLAEQARGIGSDAFIQSFERICMSNISAQAVYYSIK